MMKKFISEIKTESLRLRELNEEDLEREIEKVRKLSQKESLEKIKEKWFALVQEVAFRKIGLRHFETQLLAGLFLHEGNIVEMKTGEGKTLASTLPVALNALSKKGIHVVTVNEYLAERDQKWMGKIYNGLGLTVGLVKSTSTTKQKQDSYSQDITYITNSELVFDYLRDNSAYNQNELLQRPFSYCLIDEIDSILIDEARTPLILSTAAESANLEKLLLARNLANDLQKDVHFEVDQKRREINLTEIGHKFLLKRLNKKSLYDPTDPWILDILNALKAEYIFKSFRDYLVSNNKIFIIDEFTGRIMEDRRWSLGIHEAIEVKENVSLRSGTKTKSSITYQNFFTLYPKLAGMTGTAKTTEKEFRDIYGLNVIELPTFKPMIRQDLSDCVYQSEVSKFKAVLQKAKESYTTGQPILIGTSNVAKSETLSLLFKENEIPHKLLNAKPENVNRESEIVAQAGQRYAVTIATNMAGRGTDIILGGNPTFQVKQILIESLFEKKNLLQKDSSFEDLITIVLKDYHFELEKLERDILNLPYSLESCKQSLQILYEYLYKKNYIIWEQENRLVKQLGGLFVLGTERHETRRIDNQLRGRAGRQGDPGKSQFFLSLEDDLLKIFGAESIGRWMNFLVEDKDSPLESNQLTNSLEAAQKKVELYNYDLRKNIFQYDEVVNTQRKQVFQGRNEILSNNNIEEIFLRYGEYLFDELTKKSSVLSSIEFSSRLEEFFDSYSTYFLFTLEKIPSFDFYKEIWISNDLRFAQSNFYQLAFLKNTRSVKILKFLDNYWTEHLERINYIRETITWSSYGQQNPLVEYNLKAVESFKVMFEQIRLSMLYSFLSKPIYSNIQKYQQSQN